MCILLINISSHLDDTEAKLKSDGYKCPQCAAKYCELPIECKVCSLTLVSAPHLARTFHHLFPVESFERTDGKNFDGHCYGCQKKFSDLDNYVSKEFSFKIKKKNKIK